MRIQLAGHLGYSEPTRVSTVGDNDVDTDEEMGSMLCCGWMLLLSCSLTAL